MLISELLPCVVGRSDQLDRVLSASSLRPEVARLSLVVGLAGSNKGKVNRVACSAIRIAEKGTYQDCTAW